MTVNSGLTGSRVPRRIGVRGRTLGATVARLDAATLAFDRLSQGLPLRALHDAMRPLLELPLDLEMLAAILDRSTRHAPVPRTEALPATAWRPGHSVSSTARPLPWRTSPASAPRSDWQPTGQADQARMPFDKPAAPTSELLSAWAPSTPIPDGSSVSATRSRSTDQIAAHAAAKPAGFAGSAHVPDNRTEITAQQTRPASQTGITAQQGLPTSRTGTTARHPRPDHRPLQPLTNPLSLIPNATPQPPPAHQPTDRLGATSLSPGSIAPIDQHLTATSGPALPGALGELIRRVDQLTADPPSHTTPLTDPAEDSLDALEEALEVLIRRDAERHGIAGWAP